MKNKAKPSITRRDFLNGVALGVAAGSGLSPLELLGTERWAGRVIKRFLSACPAGSAGQPCRLF